MAISTWRRLLWHFYRTPAARVVKWARRSGMQPALRQRVQLVRGLPSNEIHALHAQSLNREGYANVTDAVDPALASRLSGDCQAGTGAQQIRSATPESQGLLDSPPR